ncbi:MAG TPA: inositol monophosphatase family protein [Dermatophilaceae bacterium]|nr:inositol monophosphatase family protein [Dermatophilaceae bacterium]
MSEPASQPLRALHHLAVRAAVAAGRFIVEERPVNLGVADTKTSPTDVVTEMDRNCEALIRRLLHTTRPDDAILGEEGGGVAGNSGVTWVVDPIDGTVNYLYQLPAYAVSVAAVVGDPFVPGAWTPVAGAVCNPLLGEVFHARAGSGARLVNVDQLDLARDPATQGAVLTCTDPASLLGSLVGTGFGYDAADRAWQGAFVAQLLPRVRDIRRVGSAALDLAYLAAARLDGYVEVGLQPWDMAAGWLIVREAGGQVSGVAGQPPSARGVVAAGRGIHPELQALVDELLPPARAAGAP